MADESKVVKKSEVEEPNNEIFRSRIINYPTSNIGAFMHLTKVALGSGILAVPFAFKNMGLWLGLIAIIFIGAVCTYCIHILVKCAHILCRRRQIPSMGYAEVAENAFLHGLPKLQKYSRLIKFMVNIFLVLDLIGVCCIYLVFVVTNLKQVVDHYTDEHFSIRMYMVFIMIPLILMCLIRNLKFLTPFSVIANILMFVGIIITIYYIIVDLPNISERQAVVNIVHWPMFLGTVFFAFGIIAVVLSIENEMQDPTHLIGCPSILNLSMGTVILMYAIVGFLGYLKYGDDVHGSITLNLPIEDLLAQSVKLMIALSIFFTYTIQFYVLINIMWKGIKHKFSPEKLICSELIFRIIIVILIIACSAAFPRLGPFINLVGALNLGTLGFVIPPMIELGTYNGYPGFGRLKWRLWKNIFLIIFGFISIISGTYVSILEFSKETDLVI